MFNHPSGGGGGLHKMFWGSFSVEAWSFSHTEGRRKKFPRGGGGGGGKSRTFLLRLEVGGWGGGDFPIL